jgi:hypothetical protein
MSSQLEVEESGNQCNEYQVGMGAREVLKLVCGERWAQGKELLFFVFYNFIGIAFHSLSKIQLLPEDVCCACKASYIELLTFFV